MKAYAREDATARINFLANARKPFVFIINYKQDCSYIEETDVINPAELKYNLNGYSNCHNTSIQKKGKKDIFWKTDPISFDAYKHSFRIVEKHILAGNSFLTNLTCSTPISTNLSLKEIFNHSEAPYKVWLKDHFVCFSPEIFVRIKQGAIYSYPMKGTIDASLPNAREQLLNDPKEIAEHATITDLIRNDLSMIAEEVKVLRYRYVKEIQTNQGLLLQTSTEICGKLATNYLSQLGELLFKLLPAGSITGAPKYKTTKIIDEAEGNERGFYTGIVGYFDGEQLDSAVMIRFIEQKEAKLFFKSGGGITSQSNAENEYQEMRQKVYVPIY
ncbi:aminodeoxychorismate synthase component I [uncultured Bacteroides sp.]|uniref:aminodeoxychorismate synthase component I n=1 Tax=uncultured Bacteroides sp. TaxID=162156 RepID=UPI002AABB415|nr:aminodeoxychorismate synthase component I [uncultured Bacteroides sp.]